MAKPIQYTATAPDGTVATRKSHRTYSHAVLVRTSQGWSAKNWCGRVDLAQAKRSDSYRQSYVLETAIVAVGVVA